MPAGPQAARLRSNQRAGLGLVPAGVRGQRHPEPAQQEGALGLVQRPRVLAEPVDEAVVGQLAHDRLHGGPHARVIGRDSAADDGQQQGGVDPLVAGGALPAAGGMHAVVPGWP